MSSHKHQAPTYSPPHNLELQHFQSSPVQYPSYEKAYLRLSIGHEPWSLDFPGYQTKLDCQPPHHCIDGLEIEPEEKARRRKHVSFDLKGYSDTSQVQRTPTEKVSTFRAFRRTVPKDHHSKYAFGERLCARPHGPRDLIIATPSRERWNATYSDVKAYLKPRAEYDERIARSRYDPRYYASSMYPVERRGEKEEPYTITAYQK